MANYTNKFTVINRKAAGKDIGMITQRKTLLPQANLRKSSLSLRTLNKDTGVFKDESKVRDVVKQKAGTLTTENVSGATFRWEILFNGEYQVVKDVVTQKELGSIFAITNASDESAINGFQASINDIAEPLAPGVAATAGNSIATVAISGTQMNNLYTNNSGITHGTMATQSNPLFVGNLEPGLPGDDTLTAAWVNVLISTQSPEPSDDAEHCF